MYYINLQRFLFMHDEAQKIIFHAIFIINTSENLHANYCDRAGISMQPTIQINQGAAGIGLQLKC
jgi:hypothetical protein